MPLRRYQTPSLVRQTSSASIFAPLVNMMTDLPPCRLPGPLVETGSDENLVGEGFTDGDGDGEGETAGGSEGAITTGWTATGAAKFGGGIVAEVSRVYWLTA